MSELQEAASETTPEQADLLERIGTSSGPWDWAECVARHQLYYIRMCETDAEAVEYVAALLRLVECAGSLRGGRKLAEALGVKVS